MVFSVIPSPMFLLLYVGLSQVRKLLSHQNPISGTTSITSQMPLAKSPNPAVPQFPHMLEGSNSCSVYIEKGYIPDQRKFKQK
jgi:hypothetical protein